MNPSPSTTIPRVLLAAVLLLAVLVVAVPTRAGAAPSDATKTSLVGADGRNVGTVRFVEYTTYVLVRIELRGLTPGHHGMAVHETAACEGPDFLTAGDHFDLGGSAHPHHTGDLLPVVVMTDGTANLQYRIDAFRVADLFDADGTSVVLTAGPENLAHVPDRYQSSLGGPAGPDAITLETGDAGARLACGPVNTK